MCLPLLCLPFHLSRLKFPCSALIFHSFSRRSSYSSNIQPHASQARVWPHLPHHSFGIQLTSLCSVFGEEPHRLRLFFVLSISLSRGTFKCLKLHPFIAAFRLRLSGSPMPKGRREGRRASERADLIEARKRLHLGRRSREGRGPGTRDSRKVTHTAERPKT